MDLKIVSNVIDTENIKKSDIVVLTGSSAFVTLIEKGDLAEQYNGYVKQNPISVLGTKKMMVCYINEQVARTLGRRELIVGGHVLQRFFNGEVKKRKKNSVSMFVYLHKILSDDGSVRGINAEVWGYKGHKLDFIEVRMNLTVEVFGQQLIRMFGDLRKAEYADADVVIYSNGDVPTVVLELGNIQAKGNEPFECSSSKAGSFFDRKIGRFRGDKVVFDVERMGGFSWKGLVLPLAMTVMMVIAIPFYNGIKEEEFVKLQKIYQEYESQVDGLPDQGLLEMWEARRLFWNELTQKRKPVTIMGDVIISLTKMADSETGEGITLERLDVRLSSPIVVEDSEFNVELEIGVRPSSWLTAEEQASEMARLFTEAMGRNISGNVEIWDDVVTRTIKGKKYHIVKIYFNHVEGSV